MSEKQFLANGVMLPPKVLQWVGHIADAEPVMVQKEFNGKLWPNLLRPDGGETRSSSAPGTGKACNRRKEVSNP
jgi:hypothetical protein